VGRHKITLCTNLPCGVRGRTRSPEHSENNGWNRFGRNDRGWTLQPLARKANAMVPLAMPGLCLAQQPCHARASDTRAGGRIAGQAEMSLLDAHSQGLQLDPGARQSGRRSPPMSPTAAISALRRCHRKGVRRTTSSAELKTSALRGRGGAGSRPNRAEVELHAAFVQGDKYIVCNSGRGRAGHLQGPRHPALQTHTS